MIQKTSIIELAAWLQTPPGRYLLALEQQQLDAAVVDLFGFHALQLGLPELAGLGANRMSHRWLALDCLEPQQTGVSLHCEFDALPFESNSLDLVLLPHTLELSRDPHQTLREVERVLRAEGRLVILGLNPASLWGLRQTLGRLLPGGKAGQFLPHAGDLIAYWRLRDWLGLLNFEVDSAHFGGYSPPLRNGAWLERCGWLERIGQRWWPVLGAFYAIKAVKRVHGMRLLGLERKRQRNPKAATAAAMVHHHQNQTDQ